MDKWACFPIYQQHQTLPTYLKLTTDGHLNHTKQCHGRFYILKNLLWSIKHVLCALYRVLTKNLLIPIIMHVVYDNIGLYFSLHLSFVLIWSIIYLGCRWSDYLFPSNTGNSCKIHSISWTPHFQGPEQNVAHNYEIQKMTVV